MSYCHPGQMLQHSGLLTKLFKIIVLSDELKLVGPKAILTRSHTCIAFSLIQITQYRRYELIPILANIQLRSNQPETDLQLQARSVQFTLFFFNMKRLSLIDL